MTASNPFDRQSDDTTVSVEIQNRNFSDATVYVIRMGQPIRMGVVSSQNREVFSLPWPASLPLRIEARFLGGQRCTSQEILVNDGARVIVELPANLSLNGVCIAR